MAKIGVGFGLLVAAWTSTFATPSGAQTRTIHGQAGILGEWELTATLVSQINGGGRQWSGPLSLKHIGFCSVDGPEEKTGELRLDLPDPASGPVGEVAATLLIDGTVCTFKGHVADGSDGVMACPDRGDVPMMLEIQ
jgi:hypothetical protein